MPLLMKKRGKQRYVGQVRLNGQTYRKLFKDNTRASHREAILWEETKRKEIEETLTAMGSCQLPLINWANQYLDNCKTLAHKTFSEKETAFKYFFLSFDPFLNIDELNILDVLQHLRKQAQERSGNAANKDRKNLAAAWKWGEKYLGQQGFPMGSQNPFKEVDKFPAEAQPRYVPSIEDFWKVYGAARDDQDRLMLLALLHTAARRSEMFRLTWTDIDFPGSKIRLWTRKRVGGNLEADWIHMTSELKEAFSDWWKNRPIKDHTHVFLCLEQTPFCGDYYGQPFKERRWFMERLCKKAMVKKFGFHGIRHLTATALYHKGESLATIQKILRHQNPTTTQRYLKTIGVEDTKEALETLFTTRSSKVVPLIQPHQKATQATQQ